MKAGFLEKLIERLGRIGPEEVQNYFLRLAQEKGFLETVFNAIQEGIIVTDSKGRITYVNDAACGLFGLEAGEAVGKRLDERIRGLDWASLTQSGGPVSHDIEIFYPQNRFINFYVVPLVMEPREAVAGIGDSGRNESLRSERGGPRSATPATAEEVGHVMILRDITESRRTAQQTIESERLNALMLLAAGVAHEIGNPLNSLHIHLQLMERSVQKLQDGAKEIKLHGRMVPVRATVLQMSGFSAHADWSEEERWLSKAPAPPGRVFLVHGEPSSLEAQRARLAAKGWRVEAPQPGATVEL